MLHHIKTANWKVFVNVTESLLAPFKSSLFHVFLHCSIVNAFLNFLYMYSYNDI